MYKIFTPFLILLFLACGTSKNILDEPDETVLTSDTTEAINVTESFNIQVSIQQYHPYCGGMAPTEDMLNNYSPVTRNFILIDKKSLKKSDVTFRNGIIQLQLENGQYSIRETFKDVPFSEFYSKYEPTDKMYHKNDPEECYKKWWNTNLFEFEITDTTTVLKLETTLYNRCFTGNNPCIQYTGPYPP